MANLYCLNFRFLFICNCAHEFCPQTPSGWLWNSFSQLWLANATQGVELGDRDHKRAPAPFWTYEMSSSLASSFPESRDCISALILILSTESISSFQSHTGPQIGCGSEGEEPKKNANCPLYNGTWKHSCENGIQR